MKITKIVTFASVFAASGLLLADQGGSDKAVNREDGCMPDVKPKTGFYAMLSPEVGSGHMVHYRMGEMKYLSKESVLHVRDIKISSISNKYLVKVFPDPASRKYLLEHAKTTRPFINGVAFLHEGRIAWSRSIVDVFSEEWINVGIFDSENEAKMLADRIRHEGVVKSVVQELVPVGEPSKKDGTGQPASASDQAKP